MAKFINLKSISYLEGDESRVEVWLIGSENVLMLYGSEAASLLRLVEEKLSSSHLFVIEWGDELNFEE